MTRRLPAGAALALLLLSSAAPAQDARRLSGSELSTLVSGKTVEGAMTSSGAYKEFYMPDGTIRGDGYQGRWSVSGDELCFQYDAAKAPDCWSATISPSNEIGWVKNGKVDGTGILVEGNPNNF